MCGMMTKGPLCWKHFSVIDLFCFFYEGLEQILGSEGAR